MAFCTSCGTKLNDGASFCTSCGVKNGSSESAPASQPQSQTPVAKKSSGAGKLLLWIGAILLVLAVVGIGGVVYVAHRVKERVTAAMHPQPDQSAKPDQSGNPLDDILHGSSKGGNSKDGPHNDGADPNVEKGLDVIGGIMDKMGYGDPPPNPYQELPVLKSDAKRKNLCDPDDKAKEVVDDFKSVGPTGIPVIRGLTLVHVWGRLSGDSESMNSIARITDKYVHVTDSGTYFTNANDTHGYPSGSSRDVCSDDLKTARGLVTGFGDSYPQVVPAATTINVSQQIFSELKNTGKIDFRYVDLYSVQDMPDGGEGYFHWESGPLTRVESNDVSLPVIVNGTPTTLPAIHVAGTMLVESKKAQELSKNLDDKPLATELYVLDDPVNPLVLLFKQNINNFRVQITAINFPPPKPETKIEDELRKNKKAVVYGIYFDYNSDQIKKESQPVLKEIAQAMKANPDWKLTVYGHTDNIGGDTYNLDLSKRRSAAVKKALVEQYQVGADRLLTDGFGLRQPVDRNDTLEGRAKNRRVELTRE